MLSVICPGRRFYGTCIRSASTARVGIGEICAFLLICFDTIRIRYIFVNEKSSSLRATRVCAALSRRAPTSSPRAMSINLQSQIRDNSRDLNAFLRDLNEWTGDVKEKDAALSSRQDFGVSDVPSPPAEAPPVRGRLAEHKVLGEAELKATRRQVTDAPAPAPTPASPDGTNTKNDFGSKQSDASSSPSSKKKNPEETSTSSHKDRGNECFKACDFVTAVEHYTKSIEEDGPSHVAYANRAMCYLKLEEWDDADSDCDASIQQNPLYLKAHQRKGVALHNLGKFLDATMCYENALRLEPKSAVLKEERQNCKQKHEQVDGLRVTQTKRLVPIFCKEEKNENEKPETSVRSGVPAIDPIVTKTHELVVEHESAGAYTRAISDPRSPIGQEKQETKPSTASSEKPSTAESEKPSDSPKPPASSPTPKPLPPLKVPKTSFEFESSWKKVKTYPADSARKYDFLKSVDPANVCVLFRGGAPAELSDVVLTLLKGTYRAFPKSKHTVYRPCLTSTSFVQRKYGNTSNVYQYSRLLQIHHKCTVRPDYSKCPVRPDYYTQSPIQYPHTRRLKTDTFLFYEKGVQTVRFSWSTARNS